MNYRKYAINNKPIIIIITVIIFYISSNANNIVYRKLLFIWNDSQIGKINVIKYTLVMIELQ